VTERGRQLRYVILYVEDLDEAVAFYRDLVGLELRFVEEGYAELATGATRLALYERARLPDLLGEKGTAEGPAGEVCFLVDDVDAEAERLRGLGARILSGPVDRPWGHRTLHVAGPSGFVVELAQEIPRTRPRRA
jgi:lactoylglutathione lyase